MKKVKCLMPQRIREKKVGIGSPCLTIWRCEIKTLWKLGGWMRRCSPTTAWAYSHSSRTILIQNMRSVVVQNQGQSSLLQTLTSNHPENFLHVSKPQSKASKFYPTRCLFFLLPFCFAYFSSAHFHLNPSHLSWLLLPVVWGVLPLFSNIFPIRKKIL